MHLFQESHQIRDQLLQESFTIRRSIEQDLANGVALSPANSQAWLEQLQQFHNSLEKLSDRLVPAYTEDSVPIAIQHLTQTWQNSYRHLKFILNLPQNWQSEQPEVSLIIIQLLEELFKIFIQQESTQALIVIDLKQDANLNQLRIQVTYFEQPKFINSANITDLENLGEAFRVLTSGQCYYHKKDSQLTCDFSWLRTLEQSKPLNS